MIIIVGPRMPLGLMVSVLVMLAVMLSRPAHAHDPLSEEHDRHHVEKHRGEHAAHRVEADHSRNLAVARQLVVSFRETGDDGALDEAWALLKPVLKSEIRSPEALVTAAFAAQSRHEFDYALLLITQALAINSRNDEGWLLRASIHLVRGETAEAGFACRQLGNAPLIVLITCNARVALAEGNYKVALPRLKRVLDATDLTSLPVDLLAWSYSVAGDLAVGAAKPHQAIEFYRTSLGFAERTQVRAALVDVFLSSEDYESAWQSLASAPPALPLLVRRLIAAKNLNRLDGLRLVLSKVQREFATWIVAEDWLHAREMTRFFVDVVEKPELARCLALINIKLQREAEDLRLERRTRSNKCKDRSESQLAGLIESPVGL